MTKFKTLIFTLGLVSLNACKEFDGILSLNNATQISDNKDRPQVIGAGSYTASVGAKNKKTGRFTIKNNRGSLDFDFALPPEIRDENYEGPFV